MNVRAAFTLLALSALFSFQAERPAYAVAFSLQDVCGRTTTGTATKGNPADTVVTAGSTGALTVTDYDGTYAAIGNCVSTPTTAPACSLSASDTRVLKGSTVTLFARCTTPTDSITWNSPSGSPSLTSGTTIFSKTVTFTNAGSYTYSVKATSTANGAGTTSAPVTVLVGNNAAAGGEDLPICSLTVSPNSITVTQSATLSVVCQPEAASYAWDAAETNAPASPSSSTALSNLTFNTAGAYTYKVAGTSALGTGVKSSATVTVGNAVTLRGTAGRTSPGSITFPAGTQGNDWVVLFANTLGDMATPSGWTNVQKRALTNSPGWYVNLFTRQASGATSVSIPNGMSGIAVYGGGTGPGTAPAFVETSTSAGTCAQSFTRVSTLGTVVTFLVDGDSALGGVPSNFTQRFSIAQGTSALQIADRIYGSSGSASIGWAQGGPASHSATCISLELKS